MDHAFASEVEMHDVQAGQLHGNYVPDAARVRAKENGDIASLKERLSLLWIFVLFNYLYADVIALWALLGASPADTPHLGQWALAGSAVLMEIPIAMIVAARLLPFRANRMANIIAGSLVTLINGFLTFIPPLLGWGKPPGLPEYLFFATIETVCTVYIVWKAWTWSPADAGS
jgi:hypothetical protein